MIPILETERLRLRGFEQADAPAFARLNSNAEFLTYLGDGQPLNEADSWRVLAFLMGHWALRGFGMWLVEEKDSGDFVGRIGLHYPHGWPAIELGWGIHPEHWGKGYAREAAIACGHWGFQNLELESLISVIDPRNQNSIKVAERIGEQYDRTEFVKDRDCLIYMVTREAFYQHNGDIELPQSTA